ncbi:MAG TPA: LysR family transcriptional regulator, partial [Amycolatopsis sp.]|nr:LysR family transcriptional regulator [Amycolatopsis sp.]
MDLRELDAFVAVAEELHFGLAAKRLHVSQPTVTEAVKRLERDLGGQLFDRTTRRVVLTPLGSAFLPEAHAAIAAVTAAYEVGRRRARAQRELLVAFSGNVHQPLHRAILRCRTGLTGAAPIALTQEAPLDGVRGVVARTHDL